MNDPKCPNCGNPILAEAPDGLCPGCLLRAAMPAAFPGGGSGTGNRLDAELSAEVLAAHFPSLEILQLLGRGGMGAVYKARQKSLDRLVALKVLLPRVQDDPAFAERFSREARALARLSHPNIVAVYDFGHVSGRFYLLMEYVDGMNLREALQEGRFSPEEALRVVPSICDALQYAHEEGVVHRDIKPENILVDPRGRIKIADFGLAKMLHPDRADFTLTGAREVMGTPHYMAPEQLGGTAAVDHRADIYALGVVFYEMLTGELPVGRFAPPSRKVEIDGRVDDVVLRSLENDPKQRYQSARAVKSDLEAISSHTGQKTEESTGRRKRLSPLVQAAAAVSVGAVALAVVLGGSRPAGSSSPSQAPDAAAVVQTPTLTPTPGPVRSSGSLLNDERRLANVWGRVFQEWEFSSGTIVMQTGGGIAYKEPSAPRSDVISLSGSDTGAELSLPDLSADRSRVYAKLTTGAPPSSWIFAMGTGPGRESGPVIDLGAANRESHYDIAPDDSLIVYEYHPSSGPTQLVMRPLRGPGKAWTLTKGQNDALYPACSSDGKIAYCTSNTLRVMGSRGEWARRDVAIVTDEMVKKYPSFSPNGQWIVYQASAGHENNTEDIYRVRVAEGASPERLTNAPGMDAYPCYSADGSRIAFTSNRDTLTSSPGKRSGGLMMLYTMNADGTDQQRDPSSPLGVSFPRW